MLVKELRELRWHRLRATLINIRTSPAQTAHPLTIFESIVKSVTGVDETTSVLFHIVKWGLYRKITPHGVVPLEILFFNKTRGYVNKWRRDFRSYLSDPVSGKNYSIVDIGDVEERSYDLVAAGFNHSDMKHEICLEFLSPLPFEKGNHGNEFIPEQEFAYAFTERMFKLFNHNISYDIKKDNFNLLPYYWTFDDRIKQPSKRTGGIKYIKGCIGKLYLKGRFKHILPLIILGSEVHAGKMLANAQGYYLLHANPPACLDETLLDREKIYAAVRRFGKDGESTGRSNMRFPQPAMELGETIYQEIKTETYTPIPCSTLQTSRTHATCRNAETVARKDYIVQCRLKEILSTPVKQILKENCVIFVPEKFRKSVCEKIDSWISEGSRQIVESEIVPFLRDMNPEMLLEIVERYLPGQDKIMKNILMKTIRNGCISNNRCSDRTKGLQVESPLSTLLSDLYLKPFDERMKQKHIRIVRHRTKLAIFLPEGAEAKPALRTVKYALRKQELVLKKDSVAMRLADTPLTLWGVRVVTP